MTEPTPEKVKKATRWIQGSECVSDEANCTICSVCWGKILVAALAAKEEELRQLRESLPARDEAVRREAANELLLTRAALWALVSRLGGATVVTKAELTAMPKEAELVTGDSEAGLVVNARIGLKTMPWAQTPRGHSKPCPEGWPKP